MLEGFAIGGFGMFPTLLFGALCLGAAALFAIKPERRFVPLVVSTSLLTLAAGSLAFVTGVIASFTAILGATDRTVALVGVGESAHPLALALGCVVCALIATTVGTVRIAHDPASARSGG